MRATTSLILLVVVGGLYGLKNGLVSAVVMMLLLIAVFGAMGWVTNRILERLAVAEDKQ